MKIEKAIEMVKKHPYSRHEVTQDELNLMHGLLYGFQLVFFKVAEEEFLKDRADL